MEAVAQPTVRPTPKLERREENKKFANDGSLASVERALHKVAIKCHARVMAMGLPMTFDDVHQEMLMSYVQAKAAWRPDGGALFVTYLITTCYRNFNVRISKMERDRAHLGLVSFADLQPLDHDSGEGDMDFYERVDCEEEARVGVIAMYGEHLIEGAAQEMTAPLSCNPELLIEELQEAQQRKIEAVERIEGLSNHTKAVVLSLLRNARSLGEGEKLSRMGVLMTERGMTKQEQKQVRAELLKAFGVKVR